MPGLGTVSQHSSPESKITLFRSLFRGRDDVYPVRFESRKTGKSGYAPACANEWVRGICEKPRIKCTDCPHRRFLPMTDSVIRWHLSGADDTGLPFVAGVYPMLQDETLSQLSLLSPSVGDSIALTKGSVAISNPRSSHSGLVFSGVVMVKRARQQEIIACSRQRRMQACDAAALAESVSGSQD